MIRSTLALVLLALSLAWPLVAAPPASASARVGVAPAAAAATRQVAALPAPPADLTAVLERAEGAPRGDSHGSGDALSGPTPSADRPLASSRRLPARETGHRLRGRDILQYLPTGPPIHRP